MANELTLKTNNTPTIFNKDMALGALIGLSIPLIGLIAGPIGAVVGGFIGKRRIEEENSTGKRVGEPSFWNKDTAIGGLSGWAIGGLVGVSIALAIITPAIFAAHAAHTIVAPGIIFAARAVGIASSATGIAIGTYLGGKAGEKRQAAEYEEAKQQTIVRGLSQNVSPEVGQAVEYAMAHNKSWAADVTESKLMEQAQQRIH